MDLSVDFGGSTIDFVLWHGGKPAKLFSLEKYAGFHKIGPEEFFKKLDVKYERVFVTGGKSRFLKSAIKGVSVLKVGEIEAIGRGGFFLINKGFIPGRFLVVSMGTGTCMVLVNQKNGIFLNAKHVGGTGVGGGTFLALNKKLLGLTDLNKIKKLYKEGNKNKVDLSVGEIIGSGIGLVDSKATASNLGKIWRNVDFSRADLEAGIVNLIGQTIGITSVFAAMANHCNLIVLTGKLAQMKQIVAVIKSIARLYKVKIVVPKNAGFVSALGAYVE